MKKPNVCILKTDGTNCDMEMSNAFDEAGGDASIVHVNELRSGLKNLADYDILAIPGGFSYGDDIASGKVLANELNSYLHNQISDFVTAKKPILGICNGFQVLVRMGLLPFGLSDRQVASLIDNESGHFECRWVELKPQKSVCKFFQPDDFSFQSIAMQVAHGEGRFYANEEVIEQIEKNKQVIFRYSSILGTKNTKYPDNPNGSINDIAGICDPTGLIVGMMPHPERSICSFHPNRDKADISRLYAMKIFSNIIEYSKKVPKL